MEKLAAWFSAHRATAFFLNQWFLYFMAVADYRAIASASYVGTASINLVFPAIWFLSNRLIVKSVFDEFCWRSYAGYVGGSVFGALFSMWVSLHVFGAAK